MPWKDRAIARDKMKEYRHLKRLAGYCERCLRPATDGMFCDWHANYNRIKNRRYARQEAIRLRGSLRMNGGNWKGETDILPGYCHTHRSRLEQWAKNRHERKIQRSIEPITSYYPFLSRPTNSEDELMLQADAAVSRALPQQIRADVCQELLLAVLSGDVRREDMAQAAREYIKQIYRNYERPRNIVSIDAPLHSNTTRTYADVLAS